MAKKSILVIDDEPDLLAVLESRLVRDGYEFHSAPNAEIGLQKAGSVHPQVIILDVSLPDADGFEVCKKLRSNPETSGIPILMLTARITPTDEVLSLELGADEYVRKPYDFQVLSTRIKKLLEKRGEATAQKQAKEPPVVDRLESGQLVLDIKRQKVYVQKKEVFFTTLEFRILRAFLQNPGKVLDRQELIKEAWKDEVAIEDRAVDVHLTSIRKKLGPLSDYIETLYGSGYRLAELPS